MDGFFLLLGHLIGDYIVQNDWMAANKTKRGRIGDYACLFHCLFYTATICVCTAWWMPWWGVAACFLIHFPIDRFRLAHYWMVTVSGQKQFASGPLSPWSIIVVDNIFHLITLALIWLLAGWVS